MLTPYSQPQIISKIFTSGDGQQFRMVFLVVLVNGEVKGKLLSVQPLSNRASSVRGENTYPSLPVFIQAKKIVTEYISSFAPIISPYSRLLFFTSQPTRAPAFV